MSANDEKCSAPLRENLVVRRRGRELTKLFGALAVAIAGLALLCRSVWDFRDEWPSRTVPVDLNRRPGAPTSDDQPLAVGQRVYQARCVRCHGQEGHGDGPEMAKAQVRPRDLASASWHSKADRDAVRRVILNGTPDKSMPGWGGAIAAHELDSVVDYVFFLKISDLLVHAGIAPSLGQSAPPLVFRDVGGNIGTLDQLRGKVVLVAFWGTNCVPCIAELPSLESLVDRYKKTDLVVLPVCLDERNAQTARDVAARHAPNLLVYVDPSGAVPKLFDLQHLPQAVLFDREGRMLGRSYGARRWVTKQFEELMAACLGSQVSLTSEEDAEL